MKFLKLISNGNSPNNADSQAGSVYGGGASGCWSIGAVRTGASGAAGIVTFEW